MSALQAMHALEQMTGKPMAELLHLTSWTNVVVFVAIIIAAMFAAAFISK